MSRDVTVFVQGAGADAAITAALDALGASAQKAAARALNTALAAVRAKAVHIARHEYTAPAKKLFASVKTVRARANDPFAGLVLTGRPGVSLIHFKVTPKAPGRPKRRLSAHIKRAGARREIAREHGSLPFVMRKKQGGFGVFEREGKKFVMRFGPSPIQAVGRPDTQEQLAETARETFSDALAREVDALLARQGRP